MMVELGLFVLATVLWFYALCWFDARHRRKLKMAHRAALERMRYPSYSTCGKCHRPWATVEPHTTMVTWERGYFALCEGCWESLTPEQRLPYYRKQYLSDRSRNNWPSTELAVMEGK